MPPIGPNEDTLTIVKRRKLQWYDHVSRSSGLAKTILQGTVKGGRRRGRQRKRWKDNIRQGMDRPGVQQVPEGSGEQGKMEKTVCKIICGAPTTLAVKGLMMMMMMMNIKFHLKLNGILLHKILDSICFTLLDRICFEKASFLGPNWEVSNLPQQTFTDKCILLFAVRVILCS